jgi:DNA-binding MarR family transcriptional regulator
MTAASGTAVTEVIRAATAIGEHYYEAAGRVGLTVQEARLLFSLTTQPQNMLGLTSALRVPKSTMTGLIARMERDGLITRERDPADRRHLVSTPTPKGTRVAGEFARDMAARVGVALGALEGPDRDELAVLVSGILAAIEV